MSSFELTDLLAFVGTPLVPFTMNCRCGQKLRVSTGTWASNGLPTAWALCAKCDEKPVWCPRGHERRQQVFEMGITNTGGENPVPACLTGSCGYLHNEMCSDLDVLLYRSGSADAWEITEKWAKIAVNGPERMWPRIQAGQIGRARKFLRDVNPQLKAAQRKARDLGIPEPTIKQVMSGLAAR